MKTPSLNARSGSHETSLTRLRDHAAPAFVDTASEVSISGWPYCRSKYATATIPFGATDSHGKNWSSTLVVSCWTGLHVAPPSVDFETRTSVFVSAAVPFRLSAKARYRTPFRGSMSMFPAAFTLAHMSSRVWRSAQIGYLSSPSATSVMRTGSEKVWPPSSERTIMYWLNSQHSTLKFWNAT